jgi:hypothetical protein
MNGSTDLDRILTEWLDEGPKRAPERPIQLAVEHARLYPRRPDPIWFMRADAMSPRVQTFAFQPVFALLAVGLLLAAVVAVGVGSRNQQTSPPTPTAFPSIGPGPDSSTEPSPRSSPSPTPPTIQGTDQISFETGGIPIRIDIYDLVGNYVDVVEDPDSGNVPTPVQDTIGVENVAGDETRLRLAITRCPSMDEFLVTVDTVAGTLAVDGEPCTGDTLGVSSGVILQFSEAVPASDLELIYRENVSDN